MERDRLIKLAEALRAYADKITEEKQQKLASITLAAAALEILKRKLT